GTSYVVIVVNPTTVKLATTLENAVANRAIPLSSTGSGSSHSLGLLDLSRQTAFDAATTTVDVDSSNRLVFPKEHGFADGEQVVYTANGGRVIAGLESGKRYFVKLVDAKTSPTFIAQAEDDKSFIAGTRSYFAALTDAKVPATFFHVPTGGHGHGLRSDKEIKAWPDQCAAWLKQIGLLPAGR
ncbi:MAG: hypothetical protein EBR83_09200, partial [Verrucomicrobia bacterium]|nr:hypothetical protein [Verrucomicrobiota bacterium]